MPIDRDGDGPPLRRDDAKAPPQRPDDLRATPFTDDVFDDEYYGRRRGRGPSFGLIAGVVFGAAVAAVAGWYILGMREAAVVDGGIGKDGVVKADATPYKVKPEDPGGLQVENQDKLVYERLDKSAKPGSRVENLLPEPEQPKAPPMKQPDAPPQPAQPTATAAEDPLAKLVAKVEGVKETPPPASDAKTAAPAPISPAQVASTAPPPAVTADKPMSAVMTPTSPLPAEKPPATTAAAPLQLAPKASADETPPAPAPALPQAAPTPAPTPQVAEAPQAAPAPAKPAEAAPGMVTPAAPAGAMFLQLASARSEDAAMGEWKRINAKNGDLLTGLTPSVAQADLGDKGTYFRLRAGPVADKATAEGLCASLAARNVGCIVVKP